MKPSLLNVLLVEDSASDAGLLQARLQETGDAFAITRVERLATALERLQREQFDVLLLDLTLPDSSGRDTFLRARAAAPRAPIVLLTSLDDERLGAEAVRQDIQDYLVKDQATGQQIARAIRYSIERKRAQEDMRVMEERLHQARKLESLGVLALGICHDFNNLLAATLGNAELALMDVPADSPLVPRLREIIKATQRASGLSYQMLACSGLEHLALAPLDLSAFVKSAVCVLEASIPPNCRLHFDLTDGLPPVLADGARLRQALTNLVVNAAEAIGSRDGRITVATRIVQCNRECLDAVPTDRCLAEGLYVCLEVSDDGCGMDPHTRVRAFDPFFTTKFVGRGLGLSVVLGIVRGHGGAIQVDSQPDKGTNIRIFLPPAHAPVSPSRTPPG